MNTLLAHRPASSPDRSVFEENIVRVLLYFDVFEHPLTAEEIYRFLPTNSTTPLTVRAVLQRSPLSTIVTSHEGYFFLRTTPRSCVSERRAKELRAQRRIRTAFRVAQLIRHFPFVRGVMLSGELSKGVASKRSDIDFVIVAAQGRLWICRTLLVAFKKVFLFNSRKNFCINHFVTEGHLGAQLKNLYSAMEIATLKPLVNASIYDQYMLANNWIQEYFPNWRMVQRRGDSENVPSSAVQSFLEDLFPQEWTNHLEARLMRFWRNLWRRRYARLTEEERNHKFRATENISTAYGVDYQSRILNEYLARLRTHGLSYEQLSTLAGMRS